MILTLDLGTSTTKAVLWSEVGPVSVGRAAVRTVHPQPGWAEQDPEDWWRAAVTACRSACAAAGQTRPVDAVAFSAARETIVPIDSAGQPVGPALLWSDRRASAEAATRCAAAGGMDALRERTGVLFDAGTAAAKADWLATHQREVLTGARWLLAPRDLMVLRLTGVAVTDRTLASRTGWYGIDGGMLEDAPAAWLPEVVASTQVAGPLLVDPAAELGLPAGIPVVVGAGDRACEVLGVGARPTCPMVSWGTTANVSVPMPDVPRPFPRRVALSAGAVGGFLMECGLSAAGAAIDWLATLTGLTPLALLAGAASSSLGARGVTATCWFNGARSPWWEPQGGASFLGLTLAHGPADLARALVEAVAFDVVRSLELLSDGSVVLAAAGAGGGTGPVEAATDEAATDEAATDVWTSVLGGVTGRTIERRRPELAASAGALLLAGAALGQTLDLGVVNPIVDAVVPDATAIAAYRALRPASDRVARSVLSATATD